MWSKHTTEVGLSGIIGDLGADIEVWTLDRESDPSNALSVLRAVCASVCPLSASEVKRNVLTIYD